MRTAIDESRVAGDCAQALANEHLTCQSYPSAFLVVMENGFFNGQWLAINAASPYQVS